jgi:SAM-dependent methyltransferase
MTSPQPPIDKPTEREDYSLEWTQERVKAFWDWHAAHADPGTYFTVQVPDALMGLIEATLPLRGRILDLGCGLGLLGEPLMKKGFGYIAADSSPASIKAVTHRLSHNAGWCGSVVIDDGVVTLPDQFVDGVLLFETVEHLPITARGRLLSEICRVVRTGGRLLVTVPHNENLHRASVYCPACDHSFHPMQHLTSFVPSSLSQILEEAGFRTRLCRAGDLVGLQNRPLRNPLRWSALYLAQMAHLWSTRGLAKITGFHEPWLRAALPGTGPNLIWCGERI